MNFIKYMLKLFLLFCLYRFFQPSRLSGFLLVILFFGKTNGLFFYLSGVCVNVLFCFYYVDYVFNAKGLFRATQPCYARTLKLLDFI